MKATQVLLVSSVTLALILAMTVGASSREQREQKSKLLNTVSQATSGVVWKKKGTVYNYCCRHLRWNPGTYVDCDQNDYWNIPANHNPQDPGVPKGLRYGRVRLEYRPEGIDRQHGWCCARRFRMVEELDDAELTQLKYVESNQFKPDRAKYTTPVKMEKLLKYDMLTYDDDGSCFSYGPWQFRFLE